MKQPGYLAWALLAAALALAGFASLAEAAVANQSTCADVTTQATPSTLGSRYWFVVDATLSSPSTISGCQGAAQPLAERAAGDSITVKCVETTTGVSPPAAPNTVTIYAQSDNANSGSPATSPIWSTAFTGSCTAASTATFYCTSNGLVGGSPRLGLVRFIVRAVKTGGGAYDVNSDTGSSGAGFTEGSGVLRCQAEATAFTDAVAGFSPPSPSYHGGDSLRSVLSAAVDYSPASLGNLVLVCAGSSNVAGATTFTTDTVTIDLTIQGTTTAWPDDCALSQNMTITRNSAIPTFLPTGTVLYATWNTSPCGSCGSVHNVGGVTAALNRSISAPLDRTLVTDSLFPGECTQRSPVSPGDTVAFGCAWKNSRTFEANALAFRGYSTSAGFRDEASFLHGDGTMGGGGSGGWANWSSTASTSAVSSTSYHQEIDDFAAGHVGDDNFLFNWGNTTPLFFTLSGAGSFDGINISKTSGGANASSFTIGNDIELATAKGLRNASGAFVASVNVSCQRTRADNTLEPAVAMGATDASGNSPEKQFAVTQPAGTWHMTCSASWSGNNASYTIAFFHVSQFTGNLQAPVLWNVTPQVNGTALVNVTTCLREYDQASDSVMRIAPDDVVKLTVEAYNVSDDLHDLFLQNRTVMQHEDGSTATCFRSAFYAGQSVLAGGAFAYVTMNFTGNAFMGSEAYIQLENFTGNFSGNFSGNLTGNVTGSLTGSGEGNFSGNFTGNFTVLDVMGTLTLATSWDQYVPAVFWLVLMLYFAYRVAPLPFFASFFGLGAAISPIPYGPLAFVAAIMLLVIAIVVNALTQWGVVLAERVISTAKARVVAARK